ncbi:MAG TPA: phosphoglucomutase [Flavobacteriales bacterium]|jgi:phosphoglucomutase|nr:phosphoglucomutase [Flavobacteriales bacterium]
MTARENALRWLEQDTEESFKNGIQALLDGPEKELEDAFYRDLEFGTGGMRGVMGVGSNRVNKYTFGMATQGLANYLKQSFPSEQIRIAIAYDCRNNSQTFARMVAEIFSANGIEAYLFSELRPTPQLSFAVRELNCHSGIVITASHNPPEYNGYKVYWNDGAQIVAPQDKGIIEEVRKIEQLSQINFTANSSLIHELGKEMDDAFVKASLAQRRQTNVNKNLKIVLTSLHGTSITLLPRLLQEAGYENLLIVEEQAVPDGNFPTVKSPNPEEREALNMALELAEKENADLVIGTDPDSDRIGVAVRNSAGKMILLNGNQTGVLLTDYLLQNTALKGDEFIAYTIVSSDLFGDVAMHYGVDSEVCLTGFKHIAKLIKDNEEERTFIGGGEESYGFMIGDFVRDKDALTAALIFCDWLGQVLQDGENPEQYLSRIYKRHGLYKEDLISLTKKGKEGGEEIAQMMRDLRSNPPSSLGGDEIVRIDDINNGTSTDLKTGHSTPIDLPASNVLQFYTSSGSKISARPSGTEPKIKFYFSVRKEWDSTKSLSAQQKILDHTIQDIIKDLGIS